MRNLATFAVLAVLAGATAAAAQSYVAGPRGCDFIDGYGPTGPHYTVDDDHFVMTDTSLETIEYFCEFERPFGYLFGAAEVKIRAGYCMEPGPFIEPGVFTLHSRGDGTVRLDFSGWSDPLVLVDCAAG